jgi:hypothetical protein
MAVGLWAGALRNKIALPDDAPDPPDAAVTMLNTRQLNRWLGTSYTLEEVAEMDWLTFDLMAAIATALDPPRPKGKK